MDFESKKSIHTAIEFRKRLKTNAELEKLSEAHDEISGDMLSQ